MFCIGGLDFRFGTGIGIGISMVWGYTGCIAAKI
jgi:hypothetical protein